MPDEKEWRNRFFQAYKKHSKDSQYNEDWLNDMCDDLYEKNKMTTRYVSRRCFEALKNGNFCVSKLSLTEDRICKYKVKIIIEKEVCVCSKD